MENAPRQLSELEKTGEELNKLFPMVEGMNANYAAWAWQNYLKRLSNRYTVEKARALLYDELISYTPDYKLSPLLFLDNDYEASKNELLDYLNGHLSIVNDSRFHSVLYDTPRTSSGSTIMKNYDEREQKAESYSMLLDAAKTELQKSKLSAKEKAKYSAEIEAIEQEVLHSTGEEQIDVYNRAKLKLIKIKAKLNP